MMFLLFGYVLVPVAFVMMVKNYETINWLWLAFLVLSLFIGIAPFVAIAYLVTATETNKNNKSSAPAINEAVTYRSDGSYIVYKAEDTSTALSPGKMAFRVIGGVIAGATIAFGLLFVGVILLFTLAPSVACGGSSKCY